MFFSTGIHVSLLIALFILFYSFFCQAAEKEPAVMLDTIVVTTDKEEDNFQIGDVDIEETPVFFSVIKRSQFEGKIKSLAEIIEKEAGVQVRQAGGLGSYSVVSLRGSSSEQVLVYMDGILLNEASGGGVDLSNISLSDVEAIEVYRGVTPINFGKASIGGVVNIRTLRSLQDFKASATVGYGSFNMRKMSAFLNHKPGKWDYIVSAEHLSSDNDFEFTNKYRLPLSPSDWKREHRKNADLEQNNVLTKLGYDLNDNLRIDFANQWFAKDQGIPRRLNDDTDTRFDTTRNITTAQVAADNIGKLGINARLRLNYSWKEEDYDDTKGEIGKGQVRTTDATTGLSSDLYLEWLTDCNTIGLTMSALHEEYETEDHFKRTNPFDSVRDTYVVGLQDTFYLFNGRLLITPAVRYMLVDEDLESALDIFGNRLFAKSDSEDYWMPQLGLKFKCLSWLTFKANMARYVREPSFFELFGDRGFFAGNPELDSETGTNYDLGFQAQWSWANPWISRLKLAGAYFQSDIDDAIVRIFNSAGTGTSKNLSEARISGIESSLQMDFLKYFSLVANSTWQDPENRSSDPILKANNGKNLPGRYENSYLVRLETRFRGIKIYTEMVNEIGIYYDSAELLPAPDLREFNAGISVLFGQVKVSLDAINLEDNQYEAYYRYPLPGRTYTVSVKYDF
jgi:iron complex outermembrane receptor protein